jgi:hypothetical protein
MFVCCDCCVLSGRGLCEGLITRPEESSRLWRVVVCDQETSKTRRLKPATGLWKIQPRWVVTPGKQTTTTDLRYCQQCNEKEYCGLPRSSEIRLKGNAEREASRSALFTKYHYGQRFKETKIGRACNMHGRHYKCKQNFYRKIWCNLVRRRSRRKVDNKIELH